MTSRSDVLFSATTDELEHFTELIAAISTLDDRLEVIATTRGLKFRTTERGVCELSILLEPIFFRDFDSADGMKPVQTWLDVPAFQEMLDYMVEEARDSGMHIDCTFSYHRAGDPFAVTFEDSVMVERIEFQPIAEDRMEMDSEDEVDEETTYDAEMENELFQVVPSKVCLEVLVDARVFTDMLGELSDATTDRIYLHGSKRDGEKRAIFIAGGELGYNRLQFSEQNHALKEIEVYDNQGAPSDTASVSGFYNYDILLKLLRTEVEPTAIKFQVDTLGHTIISLLVNSDNADHPSVLQFRLLMMDDLSHDVSIINNPFVEMLLDKDHKVETTTSVQGIQMERLVDVEPPAVVAQKKQKARPGKTNTRRKAAPASRKRTRRTEEFLESDTDLGTSSESEGETTRRGLKFW